MDEREEVELLSFSSLNSSPSPSFSPSFSSSSSPSSSPSCSLKEKGEKKRLKLSERLNNLEDQLSDITLLTSDQQSVRSHRIILSFIPYFHSLFHSSIFFFLFFFLTFHFLIFPPIHLSSHSPLLPLIPSFLKTTKKI